MLITTNFERTRHELVLADMREIKVTRDFFLWCISLIYLSAFASLYHQLPGLYGDKGILPARAVIPLEEDANVVYRKAKQIPTLLWLAPVFGIDVPLMMDFIAALGMVVSFGSVIWGRLRDMTNFALLWMLYFSLYQVGQTFMWFQWDILLLEAGFLCILVAPLGFLQSTVGKGFLTSLPHRPHDMISMWLVRWLLFRLMFASGVVKLTSNCPTWWNLSALSYHFQSQCIPTPLAWYAHHLPAWFLKLGVVVTFVIEMAIPFLFFIPIRSLRLFSFHSQMLLQLLIILTGNYNFFNLLTVALCISLVDDDFLLGIIGRPPLGVKGESQSLVQRIKNILVRVVEIVVIAGLAYWTFRLFTLRFREDWTIDSRIAFSFGQFERALSAAVSVSICVGVVSLVGVIIMSLYRSFTEGGTLKKLVSVCGSVIMSAVALWIFAITLVPHTAVDMKTQNSLWPIIREWHKSVDRYGVTNAYGLFRRMTGVDGRPELVIEGSNSESAGWKEYHFLYKPGSLADKPPFIIPHQPRLDWQMWFAALGSYNHNPWFVSLVYRLLDGQSEVLDLMDRSRLPFPPNNPPKFIRAILYKYTFTPPKDSKRGNKDWWIRKKVGEYFNTVDLEDTNQIVDFLNSAGIPMEKTKFLRVTNQFLKQNLLKIRNWVSKLDAPTFVWSMLSAAICIKLLTPVLRLWISSS